tara:strand:- start:1544 stop:2128 length:585 start_codon:yes stop_codon:yes gene_type:complete
MANSTEVSYGFGQLGSIHCQTANSVYPPKGMVIIAIQFLADNTPTVLRTESAAARANLGADGFQCLSTEFATHGSGDAQQALVDASISAVHTLTGANAEITVGMQAYSNTEDLCINKYLGVPPTIVTKVSGTDISFNRRLTAASTTLTFSNHTGQGGEDATGILYPKGMTIYGRWTEVKPSADADGGVICYLGY